VRRRVRDILLIVLGLALVISGACVYARYTYRAKEAGEQAQELLQELKTDIKQRQSRCMAFLHKRQAAWLQQVGLRICHGNDWKDEQHSKHQGKQETILFAERHGPLPLFVSNFEYRGSTALRTI